MYIFNKKAINMPIELSQPQISDFQISSSQEWLETNGLGGWASSSVSGANTRNYHGLFVSAIKPPVDRAVLLSKLEENVLIKEHRYELSTNQFPQKIAAEGLKFLTKFTKDLFPVFQFNVGSVEIKKTIAAIYQEDVVVVTYEVTKAEAEFILELKPFIAFRDYHSLSKDNSHINKAAEFGNGVLKLKPYDGFPSLYIFVNDSVFNFNPAWFHNFEYKQEQERGLRYAEDLFSHGNFFLKLKEGSKVGIVISTSPTTSTDAFALLAKEKIRREALIEDLPVKDHLSKILSMAADQFLVKRGEDLRTIIAGYHWFGDWGRDTMISLPGICLVNGRYEEAAKILKAFSLCIDQGMIPNRFPDQGEHPEYNTSDATLWYFVAIKKYLDYTDDETFVINELLPGLYNIIEWHDKGTRYNIRIEEDGLLYGGEHGSQLTWMDAKVGDWVVTPRIGKAVEINALWYNALLIMSELTRRERKIKESHSFHQRAEKVKAAFLATFLNNEKGYLYDYVNGNEKDSSFRPNQLFAISLPYPLLDNELGLSILKMIEDKLLTPYGLRSLAQDDPKYIPYYKGDQLSRDGAYHQGTVWSWLLGPYITAKIRLEGEEGKQAVMKLLTKFETHFYEAGIGTVSEIFDAEAPFVPKGCIAQAWGVAEVLRAYAEDLHPELMKKIIASRIKERNLEMKI
jgi:predicted glycogen debranching enzyme